MGCSGSKQTGQTVASHQQNGGPMEQPLPKHAASNAAPASGVNKQQEPASDPMPLVASPSNSTGVMQVAVAPAPATVEAGSSPAATQPATPSDNAGATPSSPGDTEDIQKIVTVAAGKGVMDVLALMKEKSGSPEYQWWCCDALAGLCAGNEDARASVYVHNGIPPILAAQKLFQWDENVQCKANWLLAILAASYSEYLGKQGAVEIVVAGMRACEESYQVQISGTRCLQNMVSGCEANTARARAAGASTLLEENLERNPEDGQLQWRGQALLQRLRSLPAEELTAVTATATPTSKPWAKLAQEVSAGHARQISGGNIPGFHGVSAQVAEKARHGVVEVVKFMRDRPTSVDVAKWCCDAIFTMINGNADIRDQAYDAGALELIIARMSAHLWEEELQLKGIWSLLSFAPSYAAQIGAKGGIGVLVLSMYKNKTSHDVQVAAVKLLSLLTLEPTQNNLRLAREANAANVVKAVIQAHVEDGTLQFRGINLLERLEPGCTSAMPKVNMIRSASMRAEEMVLSTRSMARIASARGMSMKDMKDMPVGRVADPETAAKNAQAIAEVDELAHQVDDESTDDEAGAAGEGHHHHSGHHHGNGHHHAHNASVKSTEENTSVTALSSDQHAGGSETKFSTTQPPSPAAAVTTSLPGSIDTPSRKNSGDASDRKELAGES